MLNYIVQIFRDVLLYLHRTFHRTSCASECCHSSCECMNEGESSSSSSSSHEQDKKSYLVGINTRVIIAVPDKGEKPLILICI